MKACMLAYTSYDSDFRVMRYAEALVKRGDQVDVITLRKPGNKSDEIIRGVRVFRIQDRVVKENGKFFYLRRVMRFLFHSSWLLGRLHFRQPYDLIHVHSVPDFLVFCAFIPKFFGAKIILDIHDILPEFYASRFNQGQKGILFRLLLLIEKCSCSFADHVIISNHIWEKKLIKRSVKKEKCTAMINYADTSIFFPRRRTRPADGFLMLYHGSINWHQGLDIAVKAVALINKDTPQACLHIYGNGPCLDHLASLIKQLKLEKQVLLRPVIPLQDIAEVVAQADLGIIPKRNDQFGGEAFSTKALEFMSCGIPIVVSRTKVDQYYFNDSIVRFFEPENVENLATTLNTMIGDLHLRGTLAVKALDFARQHNWGEKKQEYLNLVDNLAKMCNELRIGWVFKK